MLPKSQRLNLKTDFKWVAAGKKIESRHLKLFIRLGENKTPRVGIAVSSRIFKKATERNRAKRLVSQAFQSTIYPLREASHLPSTINIVALPKTSILSVKSADLAKELAVLLDEKNFN